MISKVSIKNDRNEVLTLRLANPYGSGFAVEDVDGLDPPVATINTAPYAGDDGASVTSTRVEPRNVVFTLRLMQMPTLSTEELRRKLSRFFRLKSRVEITVYTTLRTTVTYGYVESNEISIFDNPLRAVVSLLCMDPYLFDKDNYYVYTGVGPATPTFEFPFEDPAIDSPSIEFSLSNAGDKDLVIDNVGDEEVGVVFEIQIADDTLSFDIEKYDSTWTTVLDFMSFQLLNDILPTTGFLAGDVVRLSTVKGDKYATVIRDSTEYDIFNPLLETPGLSWIYLDPGLNHIRFSPDADNDDLSIVSWYRPGYEGA